MRKNNSNGFTIVEILAVVVILGILAGVAIPMVYRYVDKSKKQAYTTMESTIYAGAKNYVLDENKYLNNCSSGYTDIEVVGDNLLQDLQYIEKLVDPNDKSKQCVYNIYGCMESEASGESLAMHKYKIELKCIDYTGCIVYRDDGSTTACDETSDQTRGPDCGDYTPNITEWANKDSVEVRLNCIDTTSGGCAQRVYVKTFTDEAKTENIEIKDIFGNKTTCPINVYIDRTAPSKPAISNPYENTWINKSYKIQISSVDDVSGIKYFEYRYPNSSDESERNWTQWTDSSKPAGDSSAFTTTSFSLERNEIVEVRACDYAGNCSEISQSMIKIDKTLPTCMISRNIDSPDGQNGWYVSNVALSLNTNDSGGSLVASYDLTTSATPTFTGQATATQGATSGTTYYGHVKDGAGNVGICNSGVLQVDQSAPSKPVINNPYENIWSSVSYKITVSSVDDASGIEYFEYRYPNSSDESERNWTQWANSSKPAGDSSVFTTTAFSRERSEYVEIRACDYSDKCSETSLSMVKIDKTAPTVSFSLSGSVSTATCADAQSSVLQKTFTKTLSSSSLTHSVTCTNGSGLTTTSSKTYKYNSCISGNPNECVGGYVYSKIGNATPKASGTCYCRGASTGQGFPAATGTCTTSGCSCPSGMWVDSNGCSVSYSCSSGTVSGSSCYGNVWNSCKSTTNTCVGGYTE